jgi:O-antigen/teichoic acid export membrane protein
MPEGLWPEILDLKRVFQTLRTKLNPSAMKALMANQHEDRGRERYRRAGVTAGASFIAKALTLLISFVSVPLTVHYLGAERYGVWLTISSLLIWMQISDFGLAGNALINVLSEAHGNDDRKAARNYTASAFWALTAIAAILGVIFLVTFNAIPWQTVFRVSDISKGELKAACALTLAFFVFNIPFSLLPSVYNGYQDGYFANVWSIIINVVALLSLIAVTQFHGGLPLLIASLSGTRAVVNVANAYHAFFRQYRWLAPTPSAVRWSCVKRLVKLGSKYMVTQLAGLGIYQSQPMIITQLLGPSKVVIFVVTYKVLALPVDLAFMGTQPFISAFGEARARGDWGWIKGAYKRTTLGTIGLGVPVAAAIALAAEPLINIWAGPSAIPDGYVVLWLFIYTVIGVSLTPTGQMLCGIERVEPLALSIMLCALGCVGLGILFAPWWGVAGVVFAMALSKLVTFWPIQMHAARKFLRIHEPARAVEEPQYATQ